MREINFRAWDTRKKTMHNVDVLHFNRDSTVSGIEFWADDHNLQSISIRDLVIMQYVGLKGHDDTENIEKDIYVGDIIDIFWEEYPMGYYQENHMIGVVDLDETRTAWVIKSAKYEFYTPESIPDEIDGIFVSRNLMDEYDLEEIFLHTFNLSVDDITILGNIYENPELLGGIEDE